MSSFLLSTIKNELLLARFKKNWRKNNKDNFTIPTNIFDYHSVEVGKFTYGELCVKTFGFNNSRLVIGSCCSIAENNIFLLAGEHKFDGITSYPYRNKILKQYDEDIYSNGDIVIGDDVWIGERCIILSGVTIGQGSVVGAGSVVAKDIPPYSIYVGNRVLKKRFSDEIIEKMILFDFSSLNLSDFKLINEYDNVQYFLNSDLYRNHLKKKTN